MNGVREASQDSDNVFALAERVLTIPEIEAKLGLTRHAARLNQQGLLDFADPGRGPQPADAVQFPAQLSFVDPRELPRRRLTNRPGRVALLHAVAHIEFTAILLAWDLLYRFRGLPREFYRDWLTVADEEARHFSMIRGRLRELEADYGDFPVHRGLWGVAADTARDLAARLALVPRCMEARGLDVTPGMIAGLEQSGDETSAGILRRILQDEVGHVALGTRWFQWVCRQEGRAPEEHYFSLLEQHLRGAPRGPYNRELRVAAGFSEAELMRLGRS